MKFTLDVPRGTPPPGGHYVVEVLWADGGGDGGWGYLTREEAIGSLLSSLTHSEAGYVPPVIGLAHYYAGDADVAEPLNEFSVVIAVEGWTMARYNAAAKRRQQRRKW